MARFYSERGLRFLLYEVLDIDSLTQYSYYQDHSKEIFYMVLDAAHKLGRDIFRPCFEEMDRDQPEFIDGKCTVHPMVKTIMKECGEGGWMAAGAPYDFGGQQLPIMLNAACQFIFGAANFSASAFPFLTSAAARLISKFGTEEMVDTYLPKMFSGEWQGTMAMTEPQAGSSVSDVSTTVVNIPASNPQ